jgi:hypothetical protein
LQLRAAQRDASLERRPSGLVVAELGVRLADVGQRCSEHGVVVTQLALRGRERLLGILERARVLAFGRGHPTEAHQGRRVGEGLRFVIALEQHRFEHRTRTLVLTGCQQRLTERLLLPLAFEPRVAGSFEQRRGVLEHHDRIVRATGAVGQCPAEVDECSCTDPVRLDALGRAAGLTQVGLGQPEIAVDDLRVREHDQRVGEQRLCLRVTRQRAHLLDQPLGSSTRLTVAAFRQTEPHELGQLRDELLLSVELRLAFWWFLAHAKGWVG